MKWYRKLQILALLAFSVTGGLGAQVAKLAGSNLMLEDNSLDLYFAPSGLISFMKATFYPGEGICNIYSLDVVATKLELHGQGIATSESILPSGSDSYTVKSKSRFPAIVRIEKTAIMLMIGDENYRISKQDKLFAVDIRPVAAGGVLSPDRSLEYKVSLQRNPSLVGLASSTYIPDFSYPRKARIDDEASYIPRRLSLENGILNAYTFEVDDPAQPQFQYVYQFPFSPDKKINLDNYLILLTQRQADGMIPLIHPVLLTIYFYDAIMP